MKRSNNLTALCLGPLKYPVNIIRLELIKERRLPVKRYALIPKYTELLIKIITAEIAIQAKIKARQLFMKEVVNISSPSTVADVVSGRAMLGRAADWPVTAIEEVVGTAPASLCFDPASFIIDEDGSVLVDAKK
jgi:hypothetical protein